MSVRKPFVCFKAAPGYLIGAALKVGLVFCLGTVFAWADQGLLPTLTLQQALQQAVTHHPLLAGGRASVEIQQGAETVTRSAELPQITVQNNFQRANSRGSSFGASSAFTTYSSQAQLSQLITDFGKTAEEVRASHEQVVGAQENLHSTLQQVLFNVYQSYYQLLEAQATLKVQQQSVANLTSHLDQAKTFFEVGTQPKIDVTQAEVNLSNGKLSLVQAENGLAIAETNLRAAMGTPDFPPFQVTEELTAPTYAVSLDKAVEQGYNSRPDLLALLAQQKGAEASLSAAERGYFPTLTGNVSNGYIGPSFYPQSRSWSFGASLTVPIFSGLLTVGQVEQAKGTLHLVTAQVENLRLTIRQGIELAYNNFVSAKSSLQVAQDSLTFAKENYELAAERYKIGVGSFLEYTDAEVSLTQAETNLIQALGNYNINVASLEQAMGVLNTP